jgi:hypothetical protein
MKTMSAPIENFWVILKPKANLGAESVIHKLRPALCAMHGGSRANHR